MILLLLVDENGTGLRAKVIMRRDGFTLFLLTVRNEKIDKRKGESGNGHGHGQNRGTCKAQHMASN